MYANLWFWQFYLLFTEGYIPLCFLFSVEWDVQFKYTLWLKQKKRQVNYKETVKCQYLQKYSKDCVCPYLSPPHILYVYCIFSCILPSKTKQRVHPNHWITHLTGGSSDYLMMFWSSAWASESKCTLTVVQTKNIFKPLHVQMGSV